MTKRIWQIHSWLGLVAGIGLLVIGLSGSVLVFRNEVQALVNPGLMRVEPSPGQDRLPQDALLVAVNQALPEYEVTGWMIQQKAGFADIVYVIKRGTTKWELITFDPFKGEILCRPMEMNDTFIGWILELHYEFLAGHVGLLVAGLFAVMLCLLGLSGFWLYRDFWKSFFTLRWKKSARIFCSDLHKMIGISSVVFNVILGFTGAYWNLPHAVEHLIEGEPEFKIDQRLYADSLSMNRLMIQATEKIPGFRTTFLSLPSSELPLVTLYGRVPGNNPLRSDYGSTVSFDSGTGELKDVSDIRSAGAWAQVTDAFYPLHFGSFGGLPVKVIWCFVGLTPGLLAVTGFIVWRKRRQSRGEPCQKTRGVLPL